MINTVQHPESYQGVHEEADSLIAFHLSQSKGNIMVRGTDTDILIILLGMLGKHKEEGIQGQYGQIVFDCGQGNSRRFIDVTSIHLKLEENHEGFSRALLGLHALTGTDYTASFYKKGKKMPFNILKSSGNSEWFEALGAMSGEGQVDYGVIESFVCSLYASPSLDMKT